MSLVWNNRDSVNNFTSDVRNWSDQNVAVSILHGYLSWDSNNFSLENISVFFFFFFSITYEHLDISRRTYSTLAVTVVEFS